MPARLLAVLLAFLAVLVLPGAAAATSDCSDTDVVVCEPEPDVDECSAAAERTSDDELVEDCVEDEDDWAFSDELFDEPFQTHGRKLAYADGLLDWRLSDSDLDESFDADWQHLQGLDATGEITRSTRVLRRTASGRLKRVSRRALRSAKRVTVTGVLSYVAEWLEDDDGELIPTFDIDRVIIRR